MDRLQLAPRIRITAVREYTPDLAEYDGSTISDALKEDRAAFNADTMSMDEWFPFETTRITFEVIDGGE